MKCLINGLQPLLGQIICVGSKPLPSSRHILSGFVLCKPGVRLEHSVHMKRFSNGVDCCVVTYESNSRQCQGMRQLGTDQIDSSKFCTLQISSGKQPSDVIAVKQQHVQVLQLGYASREGSSYLVACSCKQRALSRWAPKEKGK